MGLSTTWVALAAAGGVYTAYPVFGDKEPALYGDPRIEVVQDFALFRELIVSCKNGEAVIRHHKIDNIFEDSRLQPHSTLSRAIAASCNA
ncbi:MAG: hypothetical protein AAGJ87_09580 [Pseudomonadota bacterium]